MIPVRSADASLCCARSAPNGGRLRCVKPLLYDERFRRHVQARLAARSPFAPLPRTDCPMPFDSYSACPGGTGKKIKFCCSDLIGELEKVQRMIEGEQFVACLDHVAKLDTTHPNRPCLLSWKLLLEQ